MAIFKTQDKQKFFFIQITNLIFNSSLLQLQNYDVNAETKIQF